jgi:hypothetical protein
MMIATTGSPLANPVLERERLMAHYGIHYDGTGYRYDGYRYAHLAGGFRFRDYRYDSLAGALSYARVKSA